jgi:hypothetical protein
MDHTNNPLDRLHKQVMLRIQMPAVRTKTALLVAKKRCDASEVGVIDVQEG